MRRLILAVVSLAVMSVAMVSAEEWATSEGSCYQKGNINVGLGIPIAPFGVYVEGDYAFHDAISGGMSVGFVTYSYAFSSWSYNEIPILARASFHPLNLTLLASKVSVRAILDPYVGVAIGWRVGWSSWTGSGSSLGYTSSAVGGFNFREHIGARWYPVSNFYVFAEEGMGFGIINFGAGLKF